MPNQANLFDAPDSADYVLHQDDGHSWLAVPMAELCRDDGIHRYISASSYKSRDGRTAYLEQDYDLKTFLHFARQQGRAVRYTVARTPGLSPIRALPRFERIRPRAH